MKLNKKAHYALQLAVYLTRSGCSNIQVIAENLKLSPTFLAQVANQMKKGGVLKSVKGPGGGYELIGEPTVRMVLSAVDSSRVVSQKDKDSFETGTIEQRTVGTLLGVMQIALGRAMNATVKKYAELRVDEERKMLNSEAAMGGTQ